MKNKKRNTLKKPVFWKMFMKRLAFCGVVALCLGCAGTIFASDYHGLATENYLESMRGSFEEEISRSYEKFSENEEQFLQSAALDAASCSVGGEMAFALVDRNTNQTVVQSSIPSLFILGREKGDKWLTYSCGNSEIADAIYHAYCETGYAESAMFIKMDDMYRKGYTFIPGVIRIMTYGDNGGTVLAEMDFTPEDTAGYEHVVMEDSTESNYSDLILFGSLRSSDLSADYLEEVLANPENWQEEADGYLVLGKDVGNLGRNEIFSASTLDLGEEGLKQYVVISACCYNFFEAGTVEILVAYGILAMATLLMAFITSYTSYMKQKSFYEMDQYRKDMTNTMAHDLKSPLMVISGFAENLLEQDLTEKSKHFTNSIMENVQYMNQIIEKVLELSKIENVDYRLQKEDVDLRALTEELVEKYAPQLDKRGLEVKLYGEGKIVADRLCMMQVLDNLISNAVKYTVEGSVIEIHVSDAAYEISNASAVNFDVEVQELVTPFVKGDDSRSGKQGSGIGLTIVKALSEQQGYQLELECEDGIFVARISM